MALDPRDAYIAPGHDEAPAPPRPKRKIGDKMPDGTVYAGISPDTNKPMYAPPADAPFTCTFNEARLYAAATPAHGHHDWRVPTKGELNVLFNNRAAIGGFNETGSYPAGWYWSSSPTSPQRAVGECFRDGRQYDTSHKGNLSSVRLVR